MASVPDKNDNDSTKKRSVVIVDMPTEFINRDILKCHFEQYGTVERLACSVSKKYAVIHFSTAEEAEKAAKHGTKIKPEAPPLKIYNRAIGDLGPKVEAPIPVPVPTTSRVVTRRKIIRTFNSPASSSSNQTSSLARDSSSSFGHTSKVSAKASEHSITNLESTESRPSSSSSSFSVHQSPLRASVKISRPSPFLRKKPSFGDKAGKSSTVVTRNPFALPPRNKLCLDRRKIVPVASKVPLEEKTSEAQIESSGLDENADGSSQLQKSACTSSEINLPDDDEDNKQLANAPDESDEHENAATHSPADGPSIGSPAEVETSTLDIVDETTEDAILYDDDASEYLDDQDQEIVEEESVLAEGEADTQDTAEVSTEEEGEIQDDEDEEDEEREENNDTNQEDNDVYESPLKRTEEVPTSSKKEEFLFKLPSTNTAQSSSTAGPSSSLFKLPFTSPFSLGNAPKPFSSSSFGIQLSGNNMSKIFAGTSTTASGFGVPSAKSEKSSDTVSEKSKAKSSSTVLPPEKEEKTESEKPKSFQFSLFSSLGPIKTLSSSSLSGLSSSGSTNTENKPSIFSGLKQAFTGGSSSGTTSIPVNKKGGGSVTTSSAKVPPPPVTVPKDTPGPNPLLLSFTPDTPEAQELFSKRSNTVEERYRILEARDKIIRSRMPRTKVNVEQATKLIGTCPDMCPEKERYMRQFQRQLLPYEMLPGQDHVVDHHKAIKVYSRSSADQEEPLPHELRPGPTLDFTMDYLLHYMVPLGDNPDENLSDWYNFLWDRTRSIRKDITQQQIIDQTAVSLYEKCARFHIHCASRLCELDVHSFDPKLNDENLMKCLQSLEHLYEDLRRRQVTCPSEPEFRAYQIMMNLNEGDALYNAQQLPSWILNSNQVQIALKLHHSIYTKNFVAFFKTVESLPYMTSCILHRYFFQVRSLALRCFIKAHCTLPKFETVMLMSTLQRMLGYGSAVQSFKYLCEAHGIQCDIDENKLTLARKLFYLPDFPSIYREAHLIDSKLQTSVAEAINGGPLPSIDFVNRKPHSSFNENCQLISGDIIGSHDSRAEAFVPPEPSGAGRINKPVIQSAFSIGFSHGGVFSQAKKKELIQPPKPQRQIESVCQAVTSELIDESVKQDVVNLSKARLEEAKRIQEKTVKKRLHQEIATKLATEYVEKMISQHVDMMLSAQTSMRIRQCNIVNTVSQKTVTSLINESILKHVDLSASTEIHHAKEQHNRLLRTLQRIFQRLRARFVLERWKRFTRTKIVEREREEEKRREELWNFPVINSYAMSRKDVFRAFCGNSLVQPSINKADLLSVAENDSMSIPRPKRRSNDLCSEEPAVVKVPRMEADADLSDKKLQQMWEFPAVNPYTRTNRQVLEAFCGPRNISTVTNVSPNTGEKRKSEILLSLANSTHFKVHKPDYRSDVGRSFGEEIRQKASQGQTDLLQNIKSLLSQINEEKEQSKSMEPYLKKYNAIKKSCPELDLSSVSYQQDEVNPKSLSFDDDDSDWMRPTITQVLHSSILSGAFIEEENLLNEIHKFARQIREEKTKSWKTDTFLNDIDLDIIH